MPSLRETLECDPVIVQYAESKETELQRYLHHSAFLAKIKGVVFYFLGHLSHDFRMIGLGSTAWLDHTDVVVKHKLL